MKEHEPVLTRFFNVNRDTEVYKIGKIGTKAYVLFDEPHLEMLYELIGKALGKGGTERALAHLIAALDSEPCLRGWRGCYAYDAPEFGTAPEWAPKWSGGPE